MEMLHNLELQRVKVENEGNL